MLKRDSVRAILATLLFANECYPFLTIPDRTTKISQSTGAYIWFAVKPEGLAFHNVKCDFRRARPVDFQLKSMTAWFDIEALSRTCLYSAN